MNGPVADNCKDCGSDPSGYPLDHNGPLTNPDTPDKLQTHCCDTCQEKSELQGTDDVNLTLQLPSEEEDSFDSETFGQIVDPTWPEPQRPQSKLRKIWAKYRRVTMSDLQSVKMAADEQNQRHMADVKRSHSLGNGDHVHTIVNSHHTHDKRHQLPQRNSWPANHNEPVSPRGPMKSHIARLKEELVETPAKSDTTPQVAVPEEEDGVFPEPAIQRQIIVSLDTECTCTYAVSKLWYGKWEEYVGVPKGVEPGQADKPPPIEMDTHNDGNNEYINEEAWKRFVKWYGVSPSHQLDRKHLYFKDEKMFDVCILSPFSGIVEHNVKKFNRFEEIGYIECQLRRIFHVLADCRKSRLWISEKAQVPRFRQLLLRFRMLNDCIHRDKVYILALEECDANGAWPTGEPGEPKGDLSKYKDLISAPRDDEFWEREIKQSLSSVQQSLSDVVTRTVEAFLVNSRSLTREKEVALEQSRKTAAKKLEHAESREGAVKEQENSLTDKQQEMDKQQRDLEQDRAAFEEIREKFKEEQERMESLHKIQETKIKLDVGGQVYTTSVLTLRRDTDSMLAAMFSGKYEIRKEDDGSYFIDRDGTFFRYVLNFLRDGYLEAGTLPQDTVTLRELHREAKYYQLSELVSYLEKLLLSANGTSDATNATSK